MPHRARRKFAYYNLVLLHLESYYLYVTFYFKIHNFKIHKIVGREGGRTKSGLL
eukprot:SAG31_NODE_351_length_17237_cov_7.010445_7_plen_54_part_00